MVVSDGLDGLFEPGVLPYVPKPAMGAAVGCEWLFGALPGAFAGGFGRRQRVLNFSGWAVHVTSPIQPTHAERLRLACGIGERCGRAGGIGAGVSLPAPGYMRGLFQGAQARQRFVVLPHRSAVRPAYLLARPLAAGHGLGVLLCGCGFRVAVRGIKKGREDHGQNDEGVGFQQLRWSSRASMSA